MSDNVQKDGEVIAMKAAFFNTNALIDGFSELEKRDVRVATVCVSNAMYANFRKLGADVIDLESDPENLKQGILAKLWGAVVRSDNTLPEDLVVFKGKEVSGFSTPSVRLTIKVPSKDISHAIEELKSMDDELCTLEERVGEVLKILGRATI